MGVYLDRVRYYWQVPLVKFLFRFLSLGLIWFVVYHLVLEPSGVLDTWMTSGVAKVAIYFMNAFGLMIQSVTNADGSVTMLLNDLNLLRIAHPCNGLELDVLFVVFVLSYGNSKLVPKVSFLIGGLIFLFFLNVLRVIALVKIQMVHPEWLDFSHKYLFTAVVYGFVLLLWWVWVERFQKQR
ncbi:hypothetical protein [Persicobacter psychrovividus]|uniref:Exosortase family protein XrtF n=1 Tax=Persicobacter psychrovividus TaxID=387638 RepID=A0ABN6L611_9BACT|nr:hypothetical protein PEPS_08950 [Persicobacter psychrovividus]